MTEKLSDAERHLLRLARRDADADGWTVVSQLIWPFVAALPDELLEKRPGKDGGQVRLTEAGAAVITYT